jgi:hypothetical protein
VCSSGVGLAMKTCIILEISLLVSYFLYMYIVYSEIPSRVLQLVKWIYKATTFCICRPVSLQCSVTAVSLE